MSLFDTLFGGTDDSAQEEQIRSNKRSREFIERQSNLARRDAKRLFSQGERKRGRGFQDALNILSRSVPESIGAFQEGNVGAQETLLAGLQQQQNAILGAPVDLSGLQPQQVQFDPSFLTQQTPATRQRRRQEAAVAAAPTPPTPPTPQGGNISPQFLADIQRFAEAQRQAPTNQLSDQRPSDSDVASIIQRLTGRSGQRFRGFA